MAQEFVNQYSRLDKLLHRAAFSSAGLQVSLADIEDKVYRSELGEHKIDRPVFVTALPRAGTTIMLNLLHNTREFASHTYKSMPFVLCPLLWHRFRSSLRSTTHQEMPRAHGDGISISIDSPEAFEEIIWSKFWRSHYREDRIEPWTRQRHPEFVSFLKSNLSKQLLLADNKEDVRYLSKNNLNIARIDCIRAIFPDATMIVPFREPLQHAASLLSQHLGFLRTHKQDKFARDYMRGIGHYDFGDNFLPVNFDNWLVGDRRADAEQLAFWLEYWIAAYRNIHRSMGDSQLLLSFDRLTRHPRSTLISVADHLELSSPDTLIDQHAVLRPPSRHAVDQSSLPKGLVSEANALYEALLNNAF